jgi:hypothetical protein
MDKIKKELKNNLEKQMSDLIKIVNILANKIDEHDVDIKKLKNRLGI